MAVNVDVGFPFAAIIEVQCRADVTILRKAVEEKKKQGVDPSGPG